jgi:catechol 2,3-dioxygenase-like lactoylglutathione lyase family enzyme
MNASTHVQRLSPSITASDLEKSIRFYTNGLGFEIESRNEVDGVLRFVMLKSGPAYIGIGQDDFAKGKGRVKGTGMRLWLRTTQDLSELAQQVEAAGFTLESEPAPLPWGPMAFTLVDPDGFLLTVTTPE